MDEQRFQNYLNLIEQLLNCHSSKQITEVLRANSSLIDWNLVQVMEWRANEMVKAGAPNAQWLRNFAAQLAEMIAQWQQLYQQVIKLYNESKWDEGLIVAEQALELASSLYQGAHPRVATSLNNLGLLHKVLGRYEQAKPLLQEALAMTQRLFEGDHADIARSLNNLALLYEAQGHYEKAKSLLEEALKMRKRLFEGAHPDVANSLNNLAGFYKVQGHYEKAEPLFEEALKMRKRLFKGAHPDVANSLNNLALLYKEQRHYEKSEPLFKEALAMRKHLFKGVHPGVANNLNDLALLYQAQGHYEKAKPLFKEALEMGKCLFKGAHPHVGNTLNNLALLYLEQGHYEKAEPLFKEALKMRKHLFKDAHPDVAISLNTLAGLHQAQGHYEKAKPLFEEALEMRKRLFKEAHPDVANTLMNLVVLLAATNRPIEALKLAQEGIELENRILYRVFAASSERDRLTYFQAVRTSFDILLSLVWKYLPNSFTAVQLALDVVLKRKSVTASVLATFNYALYSKRYPHLEEKFQKLRSLGTEIVDLTFSPSLSARGITKEEFQSQQAIYLEGLSKLTAEWEQVEKQLASQIPELQLQEQPSARFAVAIRLPEGSALVEFVQFRVFDFTASRGKKWQATRYIAFVLPSQQPEVVQMVDLGEAEQIERLILVFRQESAKLGNLLGARTKGKTTTDIQPNSNIGIELRQKIYDPIHNAISKYKYLFIAPDGDLNLLPLQILPLEGTGKQLLMDKYTISYLSVGRDILRQQLESQGSAYEPLVIADPDFNLRKGQEKQEQNQERVEKPSKIATPVGNLLSNLADEHFARVQSTQILGEAVARRLGVKPYLQAEALESHVTEKSKECPRILLIATHGHFATANEWELELLEQLLYCPVAQENQALQSFKVLLNWDFLALMEKQVIWLAENQYLDAANKLRGATAQVSKIVDKANLDHQRQDRLSARVENPMLRSGLALAGANTWRSGGSLPVEAGKGFLFAQDIINLNLWANEITVLVACQSGIGDIKVGEGVFGLRRAFAVAGAKTLIMSLWDVPEKVSVLLMEHFFDNLESGRGRAEALQAAQNYVRSISVRELRQFPLGLEILQEWLEGVKKDVSQVDEEDRPLEYPFYWGAWICQGITTPLPYSS